MIQLITILHIFTAIVIIILVLMQHGKGADVGAAFGSGASNTMFGSAGTTPFLVKVTAILAAVFFITTLSLTFFVARIYKQTETNDVTNSLSQPIPVQSSPTKPATTPKIPQSTPSIPVTK